MTAPGVPAGKAVGSRQCEEHRQKGGTQTNYRRIRQLPRNRCIRKYVLKALKRRIEKEQFSHRDGENISPEPKCRYEYPDYWKDKAKHDKNHSYPEQNGC